MISDGDTCCKNMSDNSKKNYKKSRSYPGLNLVEIGEYFYALPSPKENQRIILYAENRRANMCERVDPKQCKMYINLQINRKTQT